MRIMYDSLPRPLAPSLATQTDFNYNEACEPRDLVAHGREKEGIRIDGTTGLDESKSAMKTNRNRKQARYKEIDSEMAPKPNERKNENVEIKYAKSSEETQPSRITLSPRPYRHQAEASKNEGDDDDSVPRYNDPAAVYLTPKSQKSTWTTRAFDDDESVGSLTSKSRPLEAILMTQFDLCFHEARELVSRGRDNLGTPAIGSMWSDELETECRRLVKEDDTKQISVKEKHVKLPMKKSLKNASSIPLSSPRQQKYFDYEDCKADYDHVEITDDEDDHDTGRQSKNPTNLYMSPKNTSKPARPRRRVGEQKKRMGSVDSDDLSFLIEPLDYDESLQDTTVCEKDSSCCNFELQTQLDEVPGNATPENSISKTTNYYDFVTDNKTRLTTGGDAWFYNKESDETHVTEASTVETGIPSVIYIFHRMSEDDDITEYDGRGESYFSPRSSIPRSPVKSGMRKGLRGVLSSRFLVSPFGSAKSSGKNKVSIGKEENFTRTFVDL